MSDCYFIPCICSNWTEEHLKYTMRMLPDTSKAGWWFVEGTLLTTKANQLSLDCQDAYLMNTP